MMDSKKSGWWRLKTEPPYRSEDGVIFGVCAGLGQYFEVDPTVFRVAWAAIAVLMLLGTVNPFYVLLYPVAAWLMPKQGSMVDTVVEPVPSHSATRLFRTRYDRKIWGVCGGIARYTGVESTWIRLGVLVLFAFSYGFPTLIAYIVMAVVMPLSPAAVLTTRREYAP